MMPESEDRLSLEGKKILDRIFLRDKDEGGILLETIGMQGSGKTSFDFHLASTIRKKYPQELIFYRDCTEAPVQFNRVDNWCVFCQEGMTLRFRDYILNKEIKIDYEFFRDFEDLYQKARFGFFNVPFFLDDFLWIDFLNYLRRHMDRGNGWKTVILEEYEDIAPQYGSGEYWKRNTTFVRNAKQIRKGLVSLFVNTQKKGEVYSFVRGKLMMHSYLRGAKVDDISPLYQNLVSSAHKGEAYIDYGENFGKILFKPYPPRSPIFEVMKVLPEQKNNGKEEKVSKKYIDEIKSLHEEVNRLTELIEGKINF